MLTKKDHIAIAEIINVNAGRDEVVDALVEYMKKDNPLFNEDKFRKACYAYTK